MSTIKKLITLGILTIIYVTTFLIVFFLTDMPVGLDILLFACGFLSVIGVLLLNNNQLRKKGIGLTYELPIKEKIGHITGYIFICLAIVINTISIIIWIIRK